MTEDWIDDFAQSLVHEVRDAAIRSCDQLLSTGNQNPISRRWQRLREAAPEEFASALIADVVDSTISHFLAAVDRGSLHLSFIAAKGSSVDLPSSGGGELLGWYKGAGGWCERFSDERYFDDVSDLGHHFK